VRVQFWGTRGSIAKPGPSTARYGGNTKRFFNTPTRARGRVRISPEPSFRARGFKFDWLGVKLVAPRRKRLFALPSERMCRHFRRCFLMEECVEDVARSLGMSERTLARRLSDEGLSFTEILQQLRRDLAVRYLDDRKLHVSKIAWLLGFHEVSAFTHAFKRWTGKTPRQMRTAHAY